LIFGVVPTRATFLPKRVPDALTFEVLGPDLMWRVRHDLRAGDYFLFDEAADLMMRDAEFRSRFRHCQPLAALVGGAISMNAAHPAQ